MKINHTWSQKDWNDALKKVWQLSRDFEEILEFGLENNFITNEDIIHASDIYKDPNKEYDDDEIKDMISSRGIRDIMSIIQHEYSLDEILDELPQGEILDNISDDDLLDHLDGTWTLDAHDSEVREAYHNEIMQEIIDDYIDEQNEKTNQIDNMQPDELHRYICDIIGCGYYDKKELIKGLKRLKDKVNKNTYKIKYEA